MTPCDARKAENEAFAKIATGIGKTVANIAGHAAENQAVDWLASGKFSDICKFAPKHLPVHSICRATVTFVSHEFIQEAKVKIKYIWNVKDGGMDDMLCMMQNKKDYVKIYFQDIVKKESEKDEVLSRFDDDLLNLYATEIFELEVIGNGLSDSSSDSGGYNIM